MPKRECCTSDVFDAPPRSAGDSRGASMERFLAASSYTRPVDRQKKLPFIHAAICRFATGSGKPFQAIEILEVGCGRGDIALPMAALGCKVTAIDLDSDELEVLKKRANEAGLEFAEIACRDALAEDSGTYDIVVASEIIEHVASPERLLAQIVAHMQPDALLVITVPNGFGPWELSRAPRDRILRPSSFVPTMHDHIQFFSRRHLLQLFSGAGLTVIDSSVSDGPLSVPGNRFGLRWLQLADLRLVEALPWWMASGWYFLLARGPAATVQRAARE